MRPWLPIFDVLILFIIILPRFLQLFCLLRVMLPISLSLPHEEKQVCLLSFLFLFLLLLSIAYTSLNLQGGKLVYLLCHMLHHQLK